MTADKITKEQAAKFIKTLQQDRQERDDYVSSAASLATANMIRILFNDIEEMDLSGIELEDGEAIDVLQGPFESSRDSRR